jgi:hypothetical protein
MPVLLKHELEDFIEKFLNALDKTNSLKPADKKSFVQEIASKIMAAGGLHTEDLSKSNPKMAEMRKQLITAIGMKIGVALAGNDPKLQKQLQEMLEKALTALNALSDPKKQLKPDEIKQLAKTLAERMLSQLVPANKKEEKNEAKKDSTDVGLAALLNNLYGPAVVIIGNLYGIPNITQGLGTAMNFMNEQNRFDSDRPDYSGIENKVEGNIASRGDLFDGLEGMVQNFMATLDIAPELKNETPKSSIRSPFEINKGPQSPGSIGG